MKREISRQGWKKGGNTGGIYSNSRKKIARSMCRPGRGNKREQKNAKRGPVGDVRGSRFTRGFEGGEKVRETFIRLRGRE